MKYIRHAIPVLSILAVACLVIMGCSSRNTEPIKGKAFDAKNANVVNGEKVFMMHCHKCHPHGEAGLGPAITSNPAPQFIKRFQVRHGLGVMPSFTDSEISDKDLKDISSYLRALKSY